MIAQQEKKLRFRSKSFLKKAKDDFLSQIPLNLKMDEKPNHLQISNL